MEKRSLAEFACHKLVLRAAEYIDNQDYVAFAALFTPNGELLRPGAELLIGREAIVTAYRTRPADRITRHMITNIRVELVTPTHATARSLVLMWSGQNNDLITYFGRLAHPRQVIGEFCDQLMLEGSEWLFSRRNANFVLYRD